MIQTWNPKENPHPWKWGKGQKKFSARIKIGSWVEIDYRAGLPGWFQVVAISFDRDWIKVDGLEGEIVRHQMISYSNK